MISIAAASQGGGSAAGAIVFILLGVAVWLVPVIVAVTRRVPNTGSVIVIDLLAGWTIVGWVIALAMACRSRPAPQYLVPSGWRPPSN